MVIHSAKVQNAGRANLFAALNNASHGKRLGERWRGRGSGRRRGGKHLTKPGYLCLSVQAPRDFSFRGLSGHEDRLPFGAYGFVASMSLLSGSLAEASAFVLQKFLRGRGILLLLKNPTLFGLHGRPTSLLQKGFTLGGN